MATVGCPNWFLYITIDELDQGCSAEVDFILALLILHSENILKG